MKKVLCSALAVLLAVSVLFAGCGNEDDTSTQLSSVPEEMISTLAGGDISGKHVPLPEGFTVPEDPDLTFDPEDTISYQDETGKEVIILQAINEKSSIVKLYIDGVLTQKSIGNYEDNIIYGEIYDREDGTETDLSEAEVVESNGFICIQIHKPVSDETFSSAPTE